MALEVGIVGLPDVGKSTLFNALTAAGALAAHHPFATIEAGIRRQNPLPNRQFTLSAVLAPLQSQQPKGRGDYVISNIRDEPGANASGTFVVLTPWPSRKRT